ncbi:MAG TPA: fumarate hydratase, partial [Rectinemataceae bacterium]|nr:fumarate hydratase [Rectinemataceae bacterium]
MSHADLSRLLDFGQKDRYLRLDFPPPLRRKDSLVVETGLLSELAERAFSEIAFKFPLGHLEKLAEILKDEEASHNEKFVAGMLLRNAAVAAEGILPICQDTGTALMYGWKGSGVLTEGGDDTLSLAKGAAAAYKSRRLRTSQLGPESVTAERNTGDNLPALVDIRSVTGDAYRFLFAAKGGGSTGRTSLTMEAPAILRRDVLENVLASRIKALGAAGCPPYTIAAVLGGASPSQTMYALELATFGLLDGLPEEAEGDGSPLRSREWEKIVDRLASATGIGAQWGGRHLSLEARVIRLSRHAANLPLAVGVSCAAHRKARAFVDESGWYLEKMEDDPARHIPASTPLLPDAVEIDLDAPREIWLQKLRELSAGSAVLLSGTVTVARDAAHARAAAAVRNGGSIPSYFVDHPIFYAGPTEPAPGESTGSFGPTTASRMDSFLSPFMDLGASLVTIAKGGRGEEARAAIAEHGGVYLGSVGGAAAITARKHVVESRIADYADLGME